MISPELPFWPQAKLNRLLRRCSAPGRLPYTWETDRVFAQVEAWMRNRYLPNWLRGNRQWAGSPIEDWTRAVWGWTLPCQDVIDVICRISSSDGFRIIDVGAGRGNWTRVLIRHFGHESVIGIEPDSQDPLLYCGAFLDWLNDNGPFSKEELVFLSYPPCGAHPGSQLSVEVIDAMIPGQYLCYLGEGPHGACGVPEFHRRISREFDEFTTVPIPSESPSRLPRPWARMLVKCR